MVVKGADRRAWPRSEDREGRVLWGSGVTVELGINSGASRIAVLDASDVSPVSGARGEAA
jgi:hypothetical protein